MANEKDICHACAVQDKCPCRKHWRSNNPICDCSGYVEDKTNLNAKTLTDEIENIDELREEISNTISEIVNYAVPKLNKIILAMTEIIAEYSNKKENNK